MCVCIILCFVWSSPGGGNWPCIPSTGVLVAAGLGVGWLPVDVPL